MLLYERKAEGGRPLMPLDFIMEAIGSHGWFLSRVVTRSEFALGSCLWKQHGSTIRDNESRGRETGEEAGAVIWAGSNHKIVM